ncbi:hypothetical protein [Ewingella americana]|uniref:Uncharacterized protein n=1 Tax=Ewingella americana TaxID=41202 RepID=A0A502GDW2_9GAMM|nr:hypothetical protein [Ewingella americana]TPG60054.1 hypothetical protein EAH77_15925 [Ewingella americana]
MSPTWKLNELPTIIPKKLVFKHKDTGFSASIRRDVFERIQQVAALGRELYGNNPMWRIDCVIDVEGIPRGVEVNLGEVGGGAYVDCMAESIIGRPVVKSHEELLKSMAAEGYKYVFNPKWIKKFTLSEHFWMKSMPSISLDDALWYHERGEKMKLITYSVDEEMFPLSEHFPIDYKNIHNLNFKSHLVDLCVQHPDVFVETKHLSDIETSENRKWVFKTNYSCQGMDVKIQDSNFDSKAYPDLDREGAHDKIAQRFVESEQNRGYSIVVGVFANGSVYCLINPTLIVGAGFKNTMWVPLLDLHD